MLPCIFWCRMNKTFEQLVSKGKLFRVKPQCSEFKNAFGTRGRSLSPCKDWNFVLASASLQWYLKQQPANLIYQNEPSVKDNQSTVIGAEMNDS